MRSTTVLLTSLSPPPHSDGVNGTRTQLRSYVDVIFECIMWYPLCNDVYDIKTSVQCREIHNWQQQCFASWLICTHYFAELILLELATAVYIVCHINTLIVIVAVDIKTDTILWFDLNRF